jgi:hypothetical protein
LDLKPTEAQDLRLRCGYAVPRDQTTFALCRMASFQSKNMSDKCVLCPVMVGNHVPRRPGCEKHKVCSGCFWGATGEDAMDTYFCGLVRRQFVMEKENQNQQQAEESLCSSGSNSAPVNKDGKLSPMPPAVSKPLPSDSTQSWPQALVLTAKVTPVQKAKRGHGQQVPAGDGAAQSKKKGASRKAASSTILHARKISTGPSKISTLRRVLCSTT